QRARFPRIAHLTLGPLLDAVRREDDLRVVDENVDRSPTLNDGLHGRIDLLDHAHVALDCKRFAADRLDLSCRGNDAVVPTGEHRDLRALFREGDRLTLADALAGTCDDRDLVLEYGTHS